MVVTKVRTSPIQDAATRACVDRIVSEAPPLTAAILDKVGHIMNGDHTEARVSSPEREQVRRELWDAEEALRKANLALKDAMAGCQGCGLTHKVHTLQKNKGLGYHDFAPMTPDETIAVIELHKPKLAEAERAVAKANEKSEA